MSDAKERYSSNVGTYVNNEQGKHEHEKSKRREGKYNDNWKKQSVNLNEIVDRFAPGAEGKQVNGKFIYFGIDYNVVADMPSGYLRIMDNKTKKYVKLDGAIGLPKETHFKIKRREEM